MNPPPEPQHGGFGRRKWATLCLCFGSYFLFLSPCSLIQGLSFYFSLWNRSRHWISWFYFFKLTTFLSFIRQSQHHLKFEVSRIWWEYIPQLTYVPGNLVWFWSKYKWFYKKIVLRAADLLSCIFMALRIHKRLFILMICVLNKGQALLHQNHKWGNWGSQITETNS